MGWLWTLGVANSSSNCNAFGDFLGEGFGRGSPAQCLAGAVVHEFGDAIEIAPGELSQISSLWQELSQKAVGVFV